MEYHCAMGRPGVCPVVSSHHLRSRVYVQTRAREVRRDNR